MSPYKSIARTKPIDALDSPPLQRVEVRRDAEPWPVRGGDRAVGRDLHGLREQPVATFGGEAGRVGTTASGRESETLLGIATRWDMIHLT